MELKTPKKVLTTLCAVLTLFSTIVPVVAAESAGLPGQKPLKYVGTYVSQINNNTSTTGASILTTNTSTKPLIKVVVDKNVVTEEVWANNQKCVTLQNSAGVTVAAKISRILDTVNFNERQNIFITPVSALTPGGKYKIVISPQLKAKNGFSTLGMTTNNKPVVVNFTVAGTSTIATYYYVKSGDTLTKIAQKYGTTVTNLLRLNNLAPNKNLYVGQKLRVK